MRYVAFHLPDGGYFQSFLDVYRSPFNLCAQNRVDFLMRAVDLSYAQQEMVSLPAGRSTKLLRRVRRSRRDRDLLAVEAVVVGSLVFPRIKAREHFLRRPLLTEAPCRNRCTPAKTPYHGVARVSSQLTGRITQRRKLTANRP